MQVRLFKISKNIHERNISVFFFQYAQCSGNFNEVSQCRFTFGNQKFNYYYYYYAKNSFIIGITDTKSLFIQPSF